jgi:hypothetical protein
MQFLMQSASSKLSIVNMNFISLSMVLLFTAGCSMSKNAEIKQTVKTEDNSTKNPNYRFIVSFFSIGSGIDKKSKNQYQEFIKEYELKNGISIVYEIVNWGKEGEINFCFKLNELNKEGQEIFILESKKILSNSPRVRFKENATSEGKN